MSIKDFSIGMGPEQVPVNGMLGKLAFMDDSFLLPFVKSSDLADPTKGANLVGYKRTEAGAVGRTVFDKLSEYAVSVKDFGAVGDGVADDTAAFQAAYNSVSAGSMILVPPGQYSVSTLTGTKFVVWNAEGAFYTGGINPLVLPGIVKSAPDKRIQIGRGNSSSSDFADFFISRNANFSGGTSGNVNTALMVDTTIGTGVTSFEWATLFKLDNNASAGENVACYAQGNKIGTGPTWALVAEARDKNSVSNPTSGLVGIEVDIFANGIDDLYNRIGIDVVVGKNLPSGTAGVCGIGMRIGPQAGDNSLGSYRTGIQLRGIYNIGIDLSTMTSSNVAIVLATGQRIAYEATLTVTSKYDSATGEIVFEGKAVRPVKGLAFRTADGLLTTTATAGSATLPANPTGFITINIDGVAKKIPYYGA